MKCMVFIRFFGQIYPLFISLFRLLIEAIPFNDPSAIIREKMKNAIYNDKH